MPQTDFKNPDVLMTVISLENHLQQGEGWNKFLEKVEQRFEAGELKKLIIITTGYLQRHYFSLGVENSLEIDLIEEKAKVLDNQWLEKQGTNLKNLKIPIEILNWQALLNRPATHDFPSFETFSQQIQNDYFNSKNKEFKQLVDDHADRYITRKIKAHLKEQKQEVNREVFFKAAINYALEEATALVQLFQCAADCLAYPNGKPPPINYIWKKYFSDVPLRYENWKPTKIKTVSVVNRYSNFLPQQNNLTMNYAQWVLNKVNWVSLTSEQQFQFIQGLDHLVFGILGSNSLEEASSPPASLKIIAHRSSV